MVKDVFIGFIEVKRMCRGGLLPGFSCTDQCEKKYEAGPFYNCVRFLFILFESEK